MKNVTPFEYLKPENCFEEYVIINLQSNNKFEIITTWENENGEKFTNVTLRSIQEQQ